MRKSLSLSLAVGAIPFAAATVGPHIGELRGTLGGEAEWVVDGDFSGPGVVTIADLGLIGASLAGEAGQVDFRQADYDDAFDQPGYGARAELSYGVSDNVEIYGAFVWTQMGGRGTQLGDIIVASTGAVTPLEANFNDYNSYGGEIGARYYFNYAFSNLRPYIGANVGAHYVETIRAGLTAPAAGVALADLGFYDGGTVYTAGAEAGVVFGDGVFWTGSVSVGLKYTSSLDASTDLDTYGIGVIADGNEHISIPVRGTLSFSF